MELEGLIRHVKDLSWDVFDRVFGVENTPGENQALRQAIRPPSEETISQDGAIVGPSDAFDWGSGGTGSTGWEMYL